MHTTHRQRSAWTAAELSEDPSWIYRLTPEEADDMASIVRAASVLPRSPFAYTRQEFPFRALPTLASAFHEMQHGRGICLVKGLPRQDLTEDQFALLTWAIGLHFGVARPQGKTSQYLSPVKNTGTVYRSPTGRGYSSNAELDFHTDGADIVVLSCFNAARSGGRSLCSSSTLAYLTIAQERPDLIAELEGPFAFSTQGEQSEGAAPFKLSPIFAERDGVSYCKWVRNRVETAQLLPGVPRLTSRQREALDYLDEVVRRPELMFCMSLEAGDMQILNTHVTLHSRTEFQDYEDETRRRTLFRLWLAPPDSPELPQGWLPAYGDVSAGAVRGGIIGQQYDDERADFDSRQARDLGMTWRGVDTAEASA